MNKKDMKPKGLNPFLPFGTYVADGEPKVFGDRVYLYGSYDLLTAAIAAGSIAPFPPRSATLPAGRSTA